MGTSIKEGAYIPEIRLLCDLSSPVTLLLPARPGQRHAGASAQADTEAAVLQEAHLRFAIGGKDEPAVSAALGPGGGW